MAAKALFRISSVGVVSTLHKGEFCMGSPCLKSTIPVVGVPVVILLMRSYSIGHCASLSKVKNWYAKSQASSMPTAQPSSIFSLGCDPLRAALKS